jgi:hypothetical protein
MEFTTKYRLKRLAVWVLVGVVAILVIGQKQWAARLHLQTELLIGIFGILIVLALFLFRRFSYLFLTVLLIVGANLPDRWSFGLSIDKLPLILALGVMAAGALLNRVSKILPTGLEPERKEKNPDGIRALTVAIARGQEHLVKTVIGMNVDLNAFDEAGRTPLMVAAAAGRTKIIEMLIEAGAEVDGKSPDGLTARDMAVQAGQIEAVVCLDEARSKASAAAT